MKIALVSVLVDDPNKAFKFYTEVLGFVKVMHIHESFLAIVASPEDQNGTSIILEPNKNLGAKEFQQRIYNADLPVIVFGTDNINNEYKRLKKLGVKFRGEPTKTEYGTQALFEDNNGNLIQLHQK